MPAALDRRDTRLLIWGGGILVLLTVAALALSPEEEPTIEFPSSYSAASKGAKAGFMLLSELGYGVEHWSYSPEDLPPIGDGRATLVIADPFVPATNREKQAIAAWVGSGGNLLVTGTAGANLLPHQSLRHVRDDDFRWKKYKAGVPSPVNRGIPEITLQTVTYWETASQPEAAIFGDDEHAVVIAYPYGKGKIIWWAVATPLTNAGLKEPGNMELLLNSVGAKDQRVLWDEYFHGERRSLYSYLESTPLLWGLAQGGVMMVAVLATFSRRSGPVRPLIPAARLSPVEFVESLGGLYQRAKAAPAAVQVAHQRFRYLLIKRLGLASTATTKELATAVRERLGWREPGLNDVLYRCERAIRDPELTDDEALQLVQALEQYTHALRLSTRSTKEKTGWKPSAS